MSTRREEPQVFKVVTIRSQFEVHVGAGQTGVHPDHGMLGFNFPLAFSIEKRCLN